jgi:tellurite resistance protein
VDSLDVERLVGSVLRGVLGGRQKRSRGALRYLTNGRSSLLNASTLLTVAGVAWGLWETATAAQSGGAAAPGGTGTAGGTIAPQPAAAPGTSVTPPPLPPTATATVQPPPLPASGTSGSAPSAAQVPGVPPEVLRVLRLTLSAARADGTLAAHEREAILAQARVVGAETLVAPELDRPRPLAEIVASATEPRARQDLYSLAFTIVRADEQVSDTERAYLAELSTHLRLDSDTVAELEREAARRIGAEAEGAQR